MTNIFEKAVRTKLRFNSNHQYGLTVEDLWDLPLQSDRKSSLDGIYKVMKNSIKTSQNESFLGTRSSEEKLTELRIEILEHIMTVRIEENKMKLTAKVNAGKVEKIKKIRADRADDSLSKMTDEELDAMEKELLS